MPEWTEQQKQAIYSKEPGIIDVYKRQIFFRVYLNSELLDISYSILYFLF